MLMNTKWNKLIWTGREIKRGKSDTSLLGKKVKNSIETEGGGGGGGGEGGGGGSIKRAFHTGEIIKMEIKSENPSIVTSPGIHNIIYAPILPTYIIINLTKWKLYVHTKSTKVHLVHTLVLTS